MKLVVAGTHQEYLRWLGEHDRHLPPGVASPANFRSVRQPEQLHGIHAFDVEDLILLGTYWENPVWGSEPYKVLMSTGVSLDLHWASPWTADWQRAEELRNRTPVSDAEIAQVAAAQAELERRLAE